MKILIISDSHGLEDEIYEVSEKFKEKMDFMIHCGDSELPATHKALKHFIVVKGNCDIDSSLPNDIEKDLGDYRIYITHGHIYNVKSNIMNICYRAAEVGANIVCFGHTHLAGCELIDGKLLINPGSFLLPKGINERTYCILSLEERNVAVTFFNHRHERLDKMCYNYIL